MSLSTDTTKNASAPYLEVLPCGCKFSHGDLIRRCSQDCGNPYPAPEKLGSPAFESAMAEFRLNRTAPIRAYYGLLEGVQWGACYACGAIGFVQPSGLKGFTCSRCELEIDANLGNPSKLPHD